MTKRALVVDGCAMARSAILVMLQRNGWEAIGAADGAEALVLAGTWHLDLVITDPKPRKVSGLQLLRGLKSNPEFPAVRVFLLVKQAERPGQAGELADDILVKNALLEKQLRDRLATRFGSERTFRKRGSTPRRVSRRRIPEASGGRSLLSATSY